MKSEEGLWAQATALSGARCGRTARDATRAAAAVFLPPALRRVQQHPGVCVRERVKCARLRNTMRHLELGGRAVRRRAIPCAIHAGRCNASPPHARGRRSRRGGPARSRRTPLAPSVCWARTLLCSRSRRSDGDARLKRCWGAARCTRHSIPHLSSLWRPPNSLQHVCGSVPRRTRVRGARPQATSCVRRSQY